MALNLFLIKKWTNMLLGKSSYHVNQNEGLIYSVEGLEGYYNNLTEKITRFGMPGTEIPITSDGDGKMRHFSIAIFQYGLAANDLYLQTKDKSMLERMSNCVAWALDNQQENGAWDTFGTRNRQYPYSSMAQGEAISLLVRYAKYDRTQECLAAAKKAYDFLLLPRDKGGVADYKEGQLFLYEFTYKPLVLNGWIFSAWGLLDYYKATGDERAKEAWLMTSKTMADSLSDFDRKFWSNYNTAQAITSSFYHKLHIAQLNVMYALTGIDPFNVYAKRWEHFQESSMNKFHAFVIKAVQKLKE